jgi:hypothetical protein
MSYDKAMKHWRNVRKCKKQSRQFMGFDASSTRWEAPGRNPEIVFYRMWRERRDEEPAHMRECLREQLKLVRAARAS